MKGAVKIFQVNGMKNNNKKTHGTIASAELKKIKQVFKITISTAGASSTKSRLKMGKKSHCKTTA